jgi:eukaryotic-like serine/threonine-protein kinase
VLLWGGALLLAAAGEAMKPRNWPKVEELYHAALAKDAAEREAFLDQACGGDEELRREVQSLLAHEAEAERLME